MIEPKNMYCKGDAEQVAGMAAKFLREVSRLPSLSVSEIAFRGEFDKLFEPFVIKRRRWLELADLLQAQGWERRRGRSLFFTADGEYINKTGSRWWPPAPAAKESE